MMITAPHPLSSSSPRDLAVWRALLDRPLPPRGSIEVECLLPGHDDSTPSMSISADGLWYCHACGRGGGDVRSLLVAVHGVSSATREYDRLLRAAPEDSAAAPSDAGSGVSPPRVEPAYLVALRRERQEIDAEARATEYLWGRGIPPFRLRDVASGVSGGAPVLEFALRRYDGAVTGKVVRALDDDGARYKTINLVKQKTRGVYATFDIASHQPTELVITEGVFDAISASLADYDAISLPQGAKSIKAARDEILELSQFAESVIIATDLDTAGEAAAQQILQLLSAIPNLRIRRLRAVRHGKDLNDTLRYFGAEAVREALDGAVAVRPQAAGWLEPPGWHFERDEPPQYFIDPVVTVGSKVLVVGLGETGKSMLLRAVAVAATAPTGASTAVGPFVVRGGHNVLWINEEVPPSYARQYFRRFQLGMGVGDLSRIHISSMSGFALDEGIWLDRLRSLLQKPGPWVVFVDSLRPVLGGVDELQGSRVSRLLTSLANALASADATCFIIAHEPKSASTPKQSIAGSLAPFNWADVSIRITRSRDESQINWTKNRNAPAPPPKSSFRIVDVGSDGLAVESVGVAGSVRGSGSAVKSGPLSPLAQQIRGLIPHLTGPLSRDSIRKALGQPHLRYDALGAALAELEDLGLVEKQEKGKQVFFYFAPPDSLRVPPYGGGDAGDR